MELKSSSGLLANLMEHVFKLHPFKDQRSLFPILIKAPCRLPGALVMLLRRVVWRILNYSMDLKIRSPARLLGEIMIDQHSN